MARGDCTRYVRLSVNPQPNHSSSVLHPLGPMLPPISPQKSPCLPVSLHVNICNIAISSCDICSYSHLDVSKGWWRTFYSFHRDNNNPPDSKKRGFQFLMNTFDRPTVCFVCGKLLRGVFYQGYFCRNTQLSCHKACIAKTPTELSPIEAANLRRRGLLNSLNHIPFHYLPRALKANFFIICLVHWKRIFSLFASYIESEFKLSDLLWTSLPTYWIC